jgi:hypothetical protein
VLRCRLSERESIRERVSEREREREREKEREQTCKRGKKEENDEARDKEIKRAREQGSSMLGARDVPANAAASAVLRHRRGLPWPTERQVER